LETRVANAGRQLVSNWFALWVEAFTEKKPSHEFHATMKDGMAQLMVSKAEERLRRQRHDNFGDPSALMR